MTSQHEPAGWTETADQGSGRRSIWVNGTLELAFEFLGSRAIELDRKMLDDMMMRASTNQGIELGDSAHGEQAPGRPVTPVA